MDHPRRSAPPVVGESHPREPLGAHLLDVAFLLGVVLKTIDGLVETAGGVPLLFVTPATLAALVRRFTAGELAADPHDVIANLLVRSTSDLTEPELRFLGVYFVVHGGVKLALVVAIAVGAVRIYPWAMGVLGAFVVFQVVELVLHPGIPLVVLTLLDLIVIALTWREWRRGRSLRDTARETGRWMRSGVRALAEGRAHRR